MKELLKINRRILMECAVVERLRRAGAVQLHPSLVNAPLIYDEAGRIALHEIYQEYIQIARIADAPLLLCTPTWRANRERVAASGVAPQVNADAVRFMQELRGTDSGIQIGGMIGCKNDCYKPKEGLSADEAEAFHAWQIEQLAGAQPDFLIAETLPCVEEALGIARAMSATGVPYVISFVISRDGRVLDGTPITDAIRRIDAATVRNAAGFMVNCAYPSFLCAEHQPPELFDRLIGVQANASSLDHCDLDGAGQLESEPVSTWGDLMMNLHTAFGIKILGGCCGTDGDHLRYLVRKS